MKRKTSPHQAALTDRTTIKVRFSEIDSMQIVWHGEYVRYFEAGLKLFGACREKFVNLFADESSEHKHPCGCPC